MNEYCCTYPIQKTKNKKQKKTKKQKQKQTNMKRQKPMKKTWTS